MCNVFPYVHDDIYKPLVMMKWNSIGPGGVAAVPGDGPVEAYMMIGPLGQPQYFYCP